MEFVNRRRIQLIFGDCEPHLLNTYQALGFRTYTERNVNSPETGYLIPLVIVAEDVDYLRRLGSPLAEVLTDFGDRARVPANIDALLAGGAAVKLERADAEGFIDDVRTTAAEADALASGLFANMSEEEIAVCLQKSALIGCQVGDRVIKRGNVAKNMAMVLSGRLEVRDGDKTIGRIGPGEMFGEIAFFLKLPRTMDVVAVEPGTKIVSLNDRAVRDLIESNSDTAAKLLYNISRILCLRVKTTTELL
jgi:CRP-like cAMP-binding protein